MANTNLVDRNFSYGGSVYLQLQPYKQSTVAKCVFVKLSLRYYGPYCIIDKFGPETYKLQLPATAKTHLYFTFHN